MGRSGLKIFMNLILGNIDAILLFLSIDAIAYESIK